MKTDNQGTNNNEIDELHLSSRFTSAVDYTRHIHIERRKGTDVPYMAHLLGVASLVMGDAGHTSFPITEDMAATAVLYDAAEDHGGLARLTDIEHNFGSNVARMVEGLSDSVTEDPRNKQSWEERKQDYIRKLREEPADVQLISAADKLYNARAILEDYREIGPRICQLRGVAVLATRRSQHLRRNIRSQQDFQHPLIQVREQLSRVWWRNLLETRTFLGPLIQFFEPRSVESQKSLFVYKARSSIRRVLGEETLQMDNHGRSNSGRRDNGQYGDGFRRPLNNGLCFQYCLRKQWNQAVAAAF